MNTDCALRMPGDLFLFDCNLMHGSGVNHSSMGRKNLYIVFNAVSNALADPFSCKFKRPEFMANREIK